MTVNTTNRHDNSVCPYLSSSVGPARNFIKRWCTSALRGRLEPLRQFVQTLRKDEAPLLACVETGLPNAIAEGVNRVMRMVKNRASGVFLMSRVVRPDLPDDRGR